MKNALDFVFIVSVLSKISFIRSQFNFIVIVFIETLLNKCTS
jgi:hypothetical protein